jgi:hypothetical protein
VYSLSFVFDGRLDGQYTLIEIWAVVLDVEAVWGRRRCYPGDGGKEGVGYFGGDASLGFH